MTRLDEVLKAKQKEDYVIARVDVQNIFTVLAAETTAVYSSQNNVNLISCKNIVIICEDKVVGVSTIDSIQDYDATRYSSIFKSKTQEPSWKAEIEFSSFIPIGQTIKEVFGDNTAIKNIVTVGYINTDEELNRLVADLNTLHGFYIKQLLSTMDIE